MQTEIAENEWGSFFEAFTLQHDRWLVSVDHEKESMPLEGIVAREHSVVITLGGDISHHRRITIDAARVLVNQKNGGDAGVEIESRDGHTTRLKLRSPMPAKE